MHPPRLAPDYSQVIRADDVTPKMRRYVRGCYGAAFGEQRFIDKSPANSFRINAIRKVFPDAQFLFLTRNGPDSVNSLINSWRSSQFEGFEVPDSVDIEGYDGTKWKHILQPGWQKHADGRLEEVCSHQWKSANHFLLEASSSLPTEAVTWAQYEDLFEDPVPTVRSMLQALGVSPEGEVVGIASSLTKNVVNASSRPGLVKWKTENSSEVQRVLDDLRLVMEDLGYDFTDYV
jgi:LPS sulfotransferase NodH